jgi:tetratricopeptide (TPR) repeat protein
LIAAVTVGCGGGAVVELSIGELLDLCHKYLLEENYEEAILTFEKAIGVEEKNALGYIGAAMADMGLEKPEEAVTVLERGLEAIEDDQGAGGAVVAMLKLITGGEYSTGAAEQIWQAAYAVWTGAAEPAEEEAKTLSDEEPIIETIEDDEEPAEASNDDVKVLLDVFSYSDFSCTFEWGEDSDLVRLNEEALGGCNLNFRMSGDLTDISDVLIASWQEDEWTNENISETGRYFSSIWKEASILGTADYFYGECTGGFPIYAEDIGKSLKVLLLVLNADYDVIGHITVPVEIPASVL